VRRVDVEGLPLWVRPVWRDPAPETLAAITAVLGS
jgi:hypothetical protein